MATAQYEAGNLAAAGSMCDLALQAAPGGPVAPLVHYQMALIALDSTDLLAAWRSLLQAERDMRPEDAESLLPPAQLRVGEQHFANGDYAEAGGCYRHIVERYPTSGTTPLARYKLAWCLLRTEQNATAIDQFLAAVELEQPLEIEADARYQAAQLLVERGDFPQVFALLSPFLDELAETGPRVHALTLLGRAALKLDELKVAQQAFAAAIEGLSDEQVPVSALAGLATAQERLGQFGEAVATLQRAIPLARGETALQMQQQLTRCSLALLDVSTTDQEEQ